MENKNHYISFGQLGQFHPTAVMAFISLLFVAAWSSVTWVLFGHILFTGDMSINLLWGQDWLLLAPRHPPVPNWLLNIFFQAGGIFGTNIISSFFLGLCMFMVYLFARRFVEPHKALLSAALLIGTSFFNSFKLIIYNHNTAQPIFWILVIYLFHCCLRGKGLHYWGFLGVAAAACLLAKFSGAFLLICVPIWLLIDREARKLLWTPGPWISLGIFLILVAPYATYFYLADRSLQVDRTYANLSAGETISELAQYHWLMFAILALTGFLWKGALSWSRPLSDDNRFLLVFAFLPLLLVFAAGGIINQQYFWEWFWPFFTLSGLLAMRFLGGRATLKRCHWGIYACIALFIIMPCVVVAQEIYAGKQANNGGLFSYAGQRFLSFSDLAYKADEILAQHTKPDSQQHRLVVTRPRFAAAFFMMKSPQIKWLPHFDLHYDPTIDEKTFCDSTLIILPQQSSQHLLSEKIENLKLLKLKPTKRMILDCMKQGVEPITFDALVRFKRRLFAQKPRPPLAIQFILLKKD